MMAAAVAADCGHKVTVLEKNEKLGKKLYITGKGRCNLTNYCTPEEFFPNIISNPKFMFSAIYGFDSAAAVAFFESLGLKTKVERGNRVFPESDKSSDVIRALSKRLEQLKVSVRLNCEVKELILSDGVFEGVKLRDESVLKADCCFVATGGLSYPITGSTGDGYRFAKSAGHKVTALLPALVSIRTDDDTPARLEGLSLKNVVLSAYCGGKLISSELGEMLFTHNGISGPLVLTLSSTAAPTLSSGNRVGLSIDLKPGLSNEQLDARIVRDFAESPNRAFANSLSKLLPAKIIPIIIERSGIEPHKQVNAVTKQEREGLVSLIKDFRLTAAGPGGYNEAVITRGGVNVREINPSTMESKLCSGLYFIGEVLDVDTLTGGYNLQVAWATAYAAATSI